MSRIKLHPENVELCKRQFAMLSDVYLLVGALLMVSAFVLTTPDSTEGVARFASGTFILAVGLLPKLKGWRCD